MGVRLRGFTTEDRRGSQRRESTTHPRRTPTHRHQLLFEAGFFRGGIFPPPRPPVTRRAPHTVGAARTMIRHSLCSSYACYEYFRRAGYGKSVHPVRRGLRSVPLGTPSVTLPTFALQNQSQTQSDTVTEIKCKVLDFIQFRIESRYCACCVR